MTTKPTGFTKDTGWQIGARRTYPVPAQVAWEALTKGNGLKIWLGKMEGGLKKGMQFSFADGTHGKVTTFRPGSHLRMQWHPPGWARPSILQVRVIEKGEDCVIAFHQEHLPDEVARQQRKAFFTEVLDQLAELF